MNTPEIISFLIDLEDEFGKEFVDDLRKTFMARDLDIEVAKALGWKNIRKVEREYKADSQWQGVPPDLGTGSFRPIPEWSSDIAAAWELVETISSSGFGYCIEKAPGEPKPTVWFVSKTQGPGIHNLKDIAETISDQSSSLPEAICRAFLKTRNQA